MDTDVLTRLEKQMEGNGLALSAVAEVLQKMDYRLAKADDEETTEAELREEEENEKEAMQYAEMEKAELIKSIAYEVTDLMKAGQYGGERGMVVDGEHVRSATKAGTAKSADDSEAAVTIDSKTENVQGIIQAMQKELNFLKEEAGGSAKEPVEEDEDAARDDEEEKEWPFEESMQNMQKQIVSLKKQFAVAGQDTSLQSMIKKESEDRLRKMGFREETSLQGPQLIKYDDPTRLGVDGTTPIKKASSSENTVDELSTLSYKQLRDMQAQIELGDTDGLPRELVG